MADLNSTTSSVKAIFALHVATAGLAAILGALATALVVKRLTNKRNSTGAPLRSTLATHLFLTLALLFLTIAYAVQAAIAGEQNKANFPVSVTSAYAYPFRGSNTSSSSAETGQGRTISILSFTFQLAEILMTVGLTAAVWLHSNNLVSNGTGVSSPSTKSRAWNAFWLTAILAFGIASWGMGFTVRGSGDTAAALTYGATLKADYVTRVLFIVFRCVVIVTSTSVSVEVLRDYSSLKKGGMPNNTERPILARFAFLVVPIIWLRNAFIVVNIVLLYQTVADWSQTSNQALAFLLIIFGQLANLAILFMVLWGAWSFGFSAGAGRTKGHGARNSYES